MTCRNANGDPDKLYLPFDDRAALATGAEE